MIWSVVGCCSGRWSVFSQPWLVVGGFQIGGRWFLWSVVGYFKLKELANVQDMSTFVPSFRLLGLLSWFFAPSYHRHRYK